MANIFSGPLAFRERTTYTTIQPYAMTMQDTTQTTMRRPHESHPDFIHLMLLVFEAVLEVVFVALPGYMCAKRGMFDVQAQKLVANLNIYIFTPCLIFTKLGSQLNAEKLWELAIIPVIFLVQTLVSWICAYLVSRAFRFGKRPSNFVTAMAVFGNSNSLPISLILSLSQTISGLHWDRIKGDNDNEVGARGILYLLIFQQLGQLVRWTWGYNVLLKSKEEYNHVESTPAPPPATAPLTLDGNAEYDEHADLESRLQGQTPVTYAHTTASYSGSNSSSTTSFQAAYSCSEGNHKIVPNDRGSTSEDSLLTSFPSPQSEERPSLMSQINAFQERTKSSIKGFFTKTGRTIRMNSRKAFSALTPPLQRLLSIIGRAISGFVLKIWSAMNPPLWAMLASVITASIPTLQYQFFAPGTFINNSVTHAISQTGGVAVPLILVVLGANLGRGTDSTTEIDEEDAAIETRLLIASLIARMLLPIVIMGPILAVMAKYVPISILDDPIFVIVCFLLTGAPSALQLAQICQTKNVYMGAMSKLLFQSYVVWIFPSTMVLVLCALEVVEWSNAS